MLEDLSGQIERITYTDAESGFTIARVKVHGRPDLVTVVGNLVDPAPGAILKMKGEWTSHPRYGEQFKVVQYKTAMPATVYGIKKYLGSGLVRGIGPKIAERIVGAFGKQTLEVIESETDRLADVDGIGKKRVAMIRQAWDEQKEIREVMVFLQSHGVSSGYATKIYKQYRDQSIAVVRENPYRLATDIFGIGFVTADRIAGNLGIEKDSPLRAGAGIIYVLQQLTDEGHVYYPYEPLVAKSIEILDVVRTVVVQALGDAALEGRIVIEDLNDDADTTRINHKAVFLAPLHVCETRLAERLQRLLETDRSLQTIAPERALSWVQQQLSISLADQQTEAVRQALANKVMIITGGPGTGKTTIINAILKIFRRLRAGILLAAPTGRAAKRMSEATGHKARTVHRLLEYSFKNGGFQKNDQQPLDCDLLVLDEASMMDTILMHHLLKAVPLRAALVLVGDVNQLPSVGAGNVLQDIMASGSVPVVVLNKIFRQARTSRIIVNAHRINQGRMPYWDAAGKQTDFYFIEQEDPERVVATVIKLVAERIPARFNLDPIDDVQVLTPMHKGLVGATNLNLRLQTALNPGSGGIVRGSRNFRINDKVMQIRNNYDKEVYNGDIGRIVDLSPESGDLQAAFDGRRVTYDHADLDEMVLAYAVSVHKSQGSEYRPW